MQQCFLILLHFVPSQTPNQEELSQLLPSQWGRVHLFDLCLWFGLSDTALALAMRGVEGCILEDCHLGPFSRSSSDPLCDCQRWKTCGYCCWAFPMEKGIWMEDWDVDLIDKWGTAGAIPAAREAAATPLTGAMLDLCSRDMDLPFSVSPKAMARLLDIAILTGNQKATVNLANKCQLRPLRRWAMTWGMEDCGKAARTALWAGAILQDLMVKDPGTNEAVPFPQALFLESKLEDWQEVCHLLPRGRDLWSPKNSDNAFGNLFLEDPEHGDGLKLSLGKIRAAKDAGVDMRFLCVAACSGPLTLLDIAVLCGEQECAEACVEGGIELKSNDGTFASHKRVLRGASNIALLVEGRHGGIKHLVPFEAQTAAAAAGRASLKRFWNESSQKGIALYQMMAKMLKGKSFPMLLVQEILAFSMPVPAIIDQLDLWLHVGDWMANICGRPASVLAAADCNAANVEKPQGVQDNHEAGAPLYIVVLVFCSHRLLPRVEIASGNHSQEP